MGRLGVEVALLSASLASGRPQEPRPEPASAIVQEDLGARLDAFLREEAKSGYQGSVLIAVDSRIVLHKGYGFSDPDHTQAVTIATPFWIASISKQFAAAAVLKLVETGRLSLEDTLARFFTSVPDDKREISIHQLLTHTSGLPQRYAADGIADRERAVAAILEGAPASRPGESFQYANDNYNLIAAIVEIVAEEPYESYVRAKLLAPVSMDHTGFWGPAENPGVAGILAGARDPSVLSPNWGYRGAVGMFSTAGNLYDWFRALETHRVLSEASWRRMSSPQVKRENVDVGYGWFLSRTAHGSLCLWTRGYEDFGHGAVLATYPDDRLVIVVTSGSGDREGTPVSHDLAKKLESLILAPP